MAVKHPFKQIAEFGCGPMSFARHAPSPAMPRHPFDRLALRETLRVGDVVAGGSDVHCGHAVV
jgi:hypothetical protein